jgi:phospholipase D1/2
MRRPPLVVGSLEVSHLSSLSQRLNAPMSFISEMEKRSGTRFEDAQVALARQWLGPDDQTLEYTVKIKSVEPGQSDPASLGLATPENAKGRVKEVKVPPTVQKAVEIIERFERGAPRSDEYVADTISQHVQQDRTSILDEKWLGESLNSSCSVRQLAECPFSFSQALTLRRKHGTS